MRGKRSEKDTLYLGPGLIPAHAGKTSSLNAIPHGREAHPRACGENIPMAKTNADLAGSSPRMRGKLAPNPIRFQRVGLIPAHAGKTH